MTGQLNFVVLHVRDMAAARAFYTEKLGLGVVAERILVGGAATLVSWGCWFPSAQPGRRRAI